MKSYKGMAYPMVKSPKGLMAPADELAAVQANMLSIILTSPGERVMEPAFGTPLGRIDYTLSPQAVTEQVRRMVAVAVRRWEPRVQVENITVRLEYQGGDLVLKITVMFIHPQKIHEAQLLTVQIPVRR